MNWDQIERKWDEMTHRVQMPSSRLPAEPSQPSRINAEFLPELETAAAGGTMRSQSDVKS